jgi:hypothetical protein
LRIATGIKRRGFLLVAGGGRKDCGSERLSLRDHLAETDIGSLAHFHIAAATGGPNGFGLPTG